MNNIYVVISMDCEPVRDAAAVIPATSGPVSYEDSATFIRGYTEQAEQYGFPISFFLHYAFASGYGGQYVYVIPELKSVIVLTTNSDASIAEMQATTNPVIKDPTWI